MAAVSGGHLFGQRGRSEGIHPISGTGTAPLCDSGAFGWLTGGEFRRIVLVMDRKTFSPSGRFVHSEDEISLVPGVALPGDGAGAPRSGVSAGPRQGSREVAAC